MIGVPSMIAAFGWGTAVPHVAWSRPITEIRAFLRENDFGFVIGDEDVAKKMGVEVRLVPHRNWRVYEEDLLDNVDERTRVLAVSQVSFYTGQNLNLKTIFLERY